ncbi:MAG: DinB family protein [Bacteroidota bacterium]
MLTLLLDLDDTLLDTNMDAFIPAYFQALSLHLASHVQSEVMLPALVSGTRAMMVSEDPSRTLQQVFDEQFYPSLGVGRDGLDAVIESFYEDVFPGLESLTERRPEAIELVRWAFSQGYRIAVATDPFFPMKGTRHRLRFAGLSPDEYKFALISSYETFHFSKSHPAYYAELLGRLGWPDGPILMVGNDAERDLAPARALGLATFWINTDDPQDTDPPSLGRGSLSDLRAWLETADFRQLEPQFKTRESIMALMRADPAAISSLIEELPASAWASRPEPSEWALNEILCHLRDMEREVNQPRVQRLTSEPEPFIAAQSTDQWAEERGYLRQDGRTAFSQFLAARLATLETLQGLSQEDWARRARHSIFGPTNLLEMVGFMATHDRIHIQQIWKLLHPQA